jgi:aldose 1-epimerase
MTATPAAHSLAIELNAGTLRAALRPDLGGSIAGLWCGAEPVLRSTEAAALTAPRQAGCYPLVPYSNRLGYRRFKWLGKDHTTEPNFDDNPHSVHGVAWLRAWETVHASAEAAELCYTHTPDAHWPFAFEVRQHFVLTPLWLEVRLTFTNLAPQPQPVGLGWHPYFTKRSRSRLHMELAERWDSDASGLPVRSVAQPGIDADVAHLNFDNCFAGWRGAARLRDEKLSVKVTSSESYLVVYTPQDKPYYCVEPVSHLSNAIHMADPAAHGLRSVAPGETFEAWMRLEVGAV